MNLINFFLRNRIKNEYLRQKFKRINERAIEYNFVFKCLTQLSPKYILDVGTGTSSLPSLMRTCGYLVTAIDNISEYWNEKIFNRHYYVINDDIRNTKLKKTFDFITCISVLEHIDDAHRAMTNLFNLVKENGYIVLTFPYNENKYVKNVYKLPNAGYGQNWPWICKIYSRKEIKNWLGLFKGKIIEQEYWKVFTGKLWTFGENIYPPEKVSKAELHHLTCLLIQKT